jgi:hypothetical protein
MVSLICIYKCTYEYFSQRNFKDEWHVNALASILLMTKVSLVLAGIHNAPFFNVSMHQCINAPTRQLVNAPTRQRINASMRQCVNEPLVKYIKASIINELESSDRSASTRQCATCQRANASID